MATVDSRRLTTALLITALVLSCETSEIQVQSDTCFCNNVDLHRSQNISERPCTAPHKPINGHYDIYKTGDTITYHCNRGYILIGQADRTCNETVNEWQPQEPYCEPEYVGHLKKRLHRIERRITTLEDITSGLRDIILSSNDTKSATTESQSPSVGANVSVLESQDSEPGKNRSRLMVCTNKTKGNDRETLAKCLTMQLGVRNGRSVSVFNWTVEDYESKRTEFAIASYYSKQFYHTVPGYKLRLRMPIGYDNDAQFDLMFMPSDSDEQLRWPFSTPFDVTVLLNNGTEFLYEYFPGHNRRCAFGRQRFETEFDCSIKSTGWESLSKNKQHVLKDDSLVVKVYMYN